MRGTVRGVLAAMVLAATVVSAAATHTSPPKKPERSPPPPPSSVQQEPEKRQNFRARRADEFPPWEGFEDCPMAFPCVGMVNRY